MSLADTYPAATASIVVSPWTTGTSSVGPQLVGVVAPEKVPLAEPTKTVIRKPAAARKWNLLHFESINRRRSAADD